MSKKHLPLCWSGIINFLNQTFNSAYLWYVWTSCSVGSGVKKVFFRKASGTSFWRFRRRRWWRELDQLFIKSASKRYEMGCKQYSHALFLSALGLWLPLFFAYLLGIELVVWVPCAPDFLLTWLFDLLVDSHLIELRAELFKFQPFSCVSSVLFGCVSWNPRGTLFWSWSTATFSAF